MRFHGWTFLLQTANFLVLLWLLRRFLWRPVLAAVDRRRREIARALDEAEAAKRATAALQESLTRERAGNVADRDALLARAHTDAEAARQELLARARAEAESAMRTARDDIERERALAIRELHERAAELGVILARRLLEQANATGVTPRLLDEALDALPDLGATPRIAVVTARPLSSDERSHCLERLRGAEVSFSVDATLIAGVELHFGSSVLHHSWRAALAEAQRELSDAGTH